MFGSFVKNCRLGADLSLREFCRLSGEDPSNWSKIERELLSPPQNTARLNTIASILNLTDYSEARKNLFDYAALDNGRIPEYIRGDEEIMAALPLFFRTIGDVKPTSEDIKQFIRDLKERQ